MQVIMPCWCTDADSVSVTEDAVKSLEGHELVIVDNGSTVGGGWLREWADLYIKNKVNLGYAKAVNQGLKLAGEVVAVANNDIRVPPQWESVAKEILEDPTVGSVHFRMIPYDQPFNPGSDIWKTGKERWCSSSFFVVRNIQLYDENFKSGVEDWAFWYEMRKKGFTTAYTNKVEYQHLDSYTLRKLPSNDENQKFNVEYFVNKYGKTPEQQFEEMFPNQLCLPWKPMP